MSGYIAKITVLALLLCNASCAPEKTLTSMMIHGDSFKIERLVVLPFSNKSKEKQLDVVATRICVNVCKRRGYQLSNVADLRIFLQRKQLFISQLTEQSTAEVFKEISKELRINAMIKGKILALNYIKVQGEALPEITLQLDLLNAQDGTTIVRSFVDSSGEDYRTVLRFGVVRTPTQLLEIMINNTIENWQHKGVIL